MKSSEIATSYQRFC